MKRLISEAFQVTIENLKKINSFDSLGHLDYVVRYGAHQAEAYSYRKYAEEIDEILKTSDQYMVKDLR